MNCCGVSWSYVGFSAQALYCSPGHWLRAWFCAALFSHFHSQLQFARSKPKPEREGGRSDEEGQPQKPWHGRCACGHKGHHAHKESIKLWHLTKQRKHKSMILFNIHGCDWLIAEIPRLLYFHWFWPHQLITEILRLLGFLRFWANLANSPNSQDFPKFSNLEALGPAPGPFSTPVLNLINLINSSFF